jgi:hypothetical protein
VSPRRGIAAGLIAATASLVAAGVAPAAAPLVRGTPSIKPAFRSDTLDYTVRCSADNKVKLSIAAPSGTAVAVGSHSKRGGDYEVPVPLEPGQQVPVRVSSGSHSRTHHIRCLPADFPGWSVERTGTPQAAGYILSPIVLGKNEPGYTAVYDRRGVPVWWMRSTRGAPVTGTLLLGGTIAWFPARGTPFSIDPIRFEDHALDGSLLRTFGAVETNTDHHELQVLPNGHAWVLSYVPRDHVDLRPWHKGYPSDATVVDGEVQEVDRHGKLVWSWKSKDHIALSESSRWSTADQVKLRDRRNAYDIVHMNSIDPHGKRVLVSVRHADAVYEIDKPTGKIVWKLGGTRTPKSLKVLGDPLVAQPLDGQHDARISADGRFLTLFDNGTRSERKPRAVRYEIDEQKRTATLRQSFTDPIVKTSGCCGTARLLPGGDWVVAWGGSTFVTETDGHGKRVLTLRLGVRLSTYRADVFLPGELQTVDLRRGMDAQAP